MNDAVYFVAAVAGFLLGIIFFGGLWWTVQRAVSSKQPAIWFLSSLLLRMGITLAGFYSVGHGDWRRLLSCVSGFVMARFFVTWFTRDTQELNRAH